MRNTKLLFLSLVLSSCVYANKFQVGDCVQFQTDAESWESQPLTERIEEIGTHSYRMSFFVQDGNHGDYYPSPFKLYFALQRDYTKVACPKVVK